MHVTVKFDIDEKRCDSETFIVHFEEYLKDILDIGYDDESDLYTIRSMEIIPTLLDATYLREETI